MQGNGNPHDGCKQRSSGLGKGAKCMPDQVTTYSRADGWRWHLRAVSRSGPGSVLVRGRLWITKLARLQLIVKTGERQLLQAGPEINADFRVIGDRSELQRTKNIVALLSLSRDSKMSLLGPLWMCAIHEQLGPLLPAGSATWKISKWRHIVGVAS